MLLADTEKVVARTPAVAAGAEAEAAPPAEPVDDERAARTADEGDQAAGELPDGVLVVVQCGLLLDGQTAQKLVELGAGILGTRFARPAFWLPKNR